MPTFSTFILLFTWLGLAAEAAAAAPAKDAPKAEAKVAKITSEQAVKIALQTIPGKATSVTIERKRGKNVYVVEILTKDQGEKDVFVDIESGEVVGTD